MPTILRLDNGLQQHQYEADYAALLRLVNDLSAKVTGLQSVQARQPTTPAPQIVVSSPAGGGSGAGLSSLVVGNLSPLFTASVDAPNVTFAAIAQAKNKFYVGPASGSDAVPTFRVIDPADLGTGTADATVFLRGDLTWGTPAGSSAWTPTKYTLSYTQVGGGPGVTYPLFTLPAGSCIHAVKIKHSTPFTGGAVSAVTVSLGPTGNATKYAGAFDIFQATGATVQQHSAVFGGESHSAGTAINANFNATGGIMNDLTAGSVDIWVWTSVAV